MRAFVGWSYARRSAHARARYRVRHSELHERPGHLELSDFDLQLVELLGVDDATNAVQREPILQVEPGERQAKRSLGFYHEDQVIHLQISAPGDVARGDRRRELADPDLRRRVLLEHESDGPFEVRQRRGSRRGDAGRLRGHFDLLDQLPEFIAVVIGRDRREHVVGRGEGTVAPHDGRIVEIESEVERDGEFRILLLLLGRLHDRLDVEVAVFVSLQERVEPTHVDVDEYFGAEQGGQVRARVEFFDANDRLAGRCRERDVSRCEGREDAPAQFPDFELCVERGLDGVHGERSERRIRKSKMNAGHHEQHEQDRYPEQSTHELCDSFPFHGLRRSGRCRG